MVMATRERRWIVKKLKGHEMEDEPDMAAAYAEFFSQIYENSERTADWETRKVHTHDGWKCLLREYDPNDDEDDAHVAAEELPLGRPILQVYYPSCTTAHIVPHSIGYKNAGYLLGEPDNGIGIIWSVRNGMIMADMMERRVDDGGFILVPIPTDGNEPTRWKFVILNEKLRKYPVYQKTTYGCLDGRELVFKTGSRYLYYHYVTTLLRYVRYDKSG